MIACPTCGLDVCAVVRNTVPWIVDPSRLVTTASLVHEAT